MSLSPTPAPARLVLSSRPFEFDLLRAADLDLGFTVATLRVLGAAYQDVAGHVVLRDGRLALGPVEARAEAGTVSVSMTLDSSVEARPMAMTLRAPAVALAPLLAAFAPPGSLDGTAELDVNLRGSARSPHELAASADGHAALAVVDGEVANALLGNLASGMLRDPRATAVLGESGRTRLRCLAVQVSMAGGTATVGTFVADAQRLLVEGTGTAAMGDETLALRLRPLLRIGGPGFAIPVRVGGTLAKPRVALDPGGLASSLVERGAAVPSSPVAGRAADGDACPAALEAVRAGRSGRLPSEPAPQPPQAKAPNAAQLLRSFLR